MSGSFVVMTWNRGGQRVTNLLTSLLVHQRHTPLEVVLVDTSDDPGVAADIVGRAADFDACHLIQAPRAHLYKSWALNVGIRATDEASRWVAVTDIDFMFGPHLVRILDDVAGPGVFVMAEPLRLPKDADLTDPFTDYDGLCKRGTWWGKTGGPGTLQCATRQWWFKARGYDERFEKGLGGMDDDVINRAKRDGLRIRRLTFEQAQALHQWHERTELKDRLQGLLRRNPPVTVNPGEWGQLREVAHA